MKTLPILFLLIVSSSVFSQNPVIKDVGMSDPHIRIFNDSIFLYSGHDSHPDDKTWVMKDWRVYSSTDLLNWNLETTISPKDNYMEDDSQDCWASDAASRNGKYYFYFSDRKRGIGVMTSDAPGGPFKDPLGKPLVAPMHDPTILIDDDENQTPYLIYGDKEGGSFHVTKLNDDMISLVEAPKSVKIIGEEWEKAPKWMDKNYIFKYKGTYYLSWGRDYATSKNIYGPYQCVGAVGQGHHLNEYAHGSFFWWKGQFYHIWCYYLRTGYKYRESIITYCHFDDDGKIVTDTDFLDQHFKNGVGQYDASWDKIQAEWYYGISEGITKRGSANYGFQLSNLQDGSWVKFANVDFNNDLHHFSAKINNIQGVGNIEIKLDDISGEEIGKVHISKSALAQKSATVSGKIKKVSGKRDLYLKFTGETNKPLFDLDWFKFTK